MLSGVACFAQQLRTKNIIIITLDGFRWQELFQGADSAILFNAKFVQDNSVKKFWHPSPLERRRKLMPFTWTTIATQGQLYGNRNYRNKVNCANPHFVSYPGYSEMLVGFIEKRIKSNDKMINPNYTVLEFIQKQEGFENKVAAFTTWEMFPYILREEKALIPVNAGNEMASGNIGARELMLNSLQPVMQNPYGPRFDLFTFQYAYEFLKRERPRVLFISLDETDEHAHGGRYDDYLSAAHNTDAMLGNLWQWIQSQDDYRDQTTLIITTDHGRGKGIQRGWRKHGIFYRGSGHIWFAVIGPDTPPYGELKYKAQYYQKQLAKTLAAFLDMNYHHHKPVGEVIEPMICPGDPYNVVSGF